MWTSLLIAASLLQVIDSSDSTSCATHDVDQDDDGDGFALMQVKNVESLPQISPPRSRGKANVSKLTLQTVALPKLGIKANKTQGNAMPSHGRTDDFKINVGSVVIESLAFLTDLLHTLSPAAKDASHWMPLVGIFGKVLGVTIVAFLFILVVLIGSGLLKISSPKAARRSDLNQLKTSWPFFLTLWASQWICMTATDQYLPSITIMQADFGTTAQMMSFTLSINWIVKAFATLLMPFLADRYGRRRLFILLPALGSCASLLCACSGCVPIFIFGRVLQGIFEGMDAILPLVQLDVFTSSEERRGFLEYFTPSLLLGPMLAPVFGGVIAHYSHWRVPFLLLALASLAQMFLAFAYIPETWTGRSERQPLIAEFTRVAGNKHLVALTLMHVCAYLLFFSIQCTYPFILGGIFTEDQLDIAWKGCVLAFIFISAGTMLPSCCYSMNGMRVFVGCLLAGVCSSFALAYYAAGSWALFFLNLCLVCLLLLPVWMITETFFFLSSEDKSGVSAVVNQFFNLLGAGLGSMVGTVVVESAQNEVSGLCCWTAGILLCINIIFWPMLGFSPPSWLRDSVAKETPYSPASDLLPCPPSPRQDKQ